MEKYLFLVFVFMVSMLTGCGPAIATIEEPELMIDLDDKDGDGITASIDCDDENSQMFPRNPEVCDDGFDNDCDPATPDESSQYYADEDGDGFGDPEAGYSTCGDATGYVTNAGDCNDLDASVNPDATESCNGTDDDCDGEIDEGELLTAYTDLDGDGFGADDSLVEVCAFSDTYVENRGDCDDSDASVNPDATEVCNGVDDNCEGKVDEGHDVDLDGTTTCAGDCNDFDASANPSATESCNGTDDDCDGDTDEGYDVDLDGVTTCAGDCDDSEALVYPGAPETCDSVDEDCDGYVDEDYDVDLDGVTTCAGDCDDADASVNPSATEIPDNGIDDDCVGGDEVTSVALDADGDGFTTADDCDDTDASVNPGATETDSAVDEDCDGNPFVSSSITLDGGGTSATITDSFNFISDESSTFLDSSSVNSIGDWVITYDRSTTATIGDLGPYTVPFLSSSGLTAGSYSAMSMLPGNLAWADDDMCVGIDVDILATEYVLSFAVRNTASNDNDICVYLDGVAQDCVTVALNTHTHADIGVVATTAGVQTLELCTGQVQGGVDMTSVGFFEASITP